MQRAGNDKANNVNQPLTERRVHRKPWNKGKLVGQKPPARLKEIWAVRIRLQLRERTRELALFNLALDSKLRSCGQLRSIRAKL